jgi:uncharacterized protein
VTPLPPDGPEEPGPTTRRLLVFARIPRYGEGAPLIAAKLGSEAAYELQRMLLARTLDEASQVRASRWLVHTPDQPAVAASVGWSSVPQGGGNIGERLERAFRTGFEEGARTCVAIDVECPALTAALLNHAFDLLEGGSEVVLGPSERGGYYLLGLAKPRPDLFQNMPWGSTQLFRTTLDRVMAGGSNPAVLPRLPNVENVEDWGNAADRGWLDRPPPPPPERRGAHAGRKPGPLG